MDSSTEAGTETDLVLDFQKQNQDILGNLQSSIPKTFEFAFKNSSKDIIKTNYGIQKLNQLNKENTIYQFTEIDNDAKTSHSEPGELKATKSRLEESEEKYRLLHQSSAFGVGYYSKDGIVISYNDIAAKNMGGKSEDFEGKSFLEIFPKEHAEEYTKRFKHALQYNDSKEYVDHIKLPNASFWFKSIYTCIYNSKNELMGVQIISDDITKSKTLENQYRTINNSIENSLNGYHIVNEKGEFVYANKEYLKRWGYHSLDELLLSNPKDHCFNPELPKQIIDEVNKNGSLEIEFLAKRKDGSTFDVLMSIIKEIDVNGDNIYLSTSLDITQLNLNNTILKENEEKFRNFVDYSSEGVAIVDNNGKITFINKEFENIFGVTSSETKGLHAWDLMLKMSNLKKEIPNTKESLKKSILGILTKKEHVILDKNFTTIIQAKTKKKKDIIETIFTFDTSKGKQLGIIITDITEIKNAEKEIISAYNLLQDTERISKSGSWTYEPKTGKNHWSKGAYDIRDVHYEKNTDLDIFKKHIHPDDSEEYFETFNRNLKSTEESFQQKFRLITENGITKIISANYKVKRDVKGEAILVVGIDKDITELELAAKSVKEQEERYKTLSAATFESILISENGMCIDQNETARKTFGYSDKEAIGKNAIEWIAPEYRELIINKLKTENLQPYQTTAQRKDKSKFHCEVQERILYKNDRKLKFTAIKDISSRVSTEKALFKSEERFNLAMEATHDGLFDWNLITNEIYYSPGWKRMLGYEDSELENTFKTWEDLTHPDDIKRSWKMLDKHIKGEIPRFEVEFRMKHKKGHWVDILARAKVTVNKENKPIRIIGTHIDLTDIKKAEQLLQFQKQISKQYLEIAGVMFIALDINQNVVLVNQKGCDILGYKEEEIIGKNWFDHFIPQHNIDQVKSVFNEALEDETNLIEYFENPIIRKDGEKRIIAWYNATLRDENGKAIRFVSSGADITERVSTQKALSESEETLRLALDSSKQGIYDFNIQTGEIKVSDSYIIMIGHNPKTFIETNEKWTNRLHPNDVNHVLKNYSDYIEGKIPAYRIEFRIKTKQGKWKWILSMGSIVEYTEDGKPLRMLGTHTDIDKIKKTQLALQQSEEKYRAMYDNAPLGYQSLDKNGDLLDVNPTWTKILGYKKEEVIGKHFGSFLHPSQVELFKERFPKFKALGNVNNVLFKMVKKDGTEIDVSYEGCAGYTPDGQFKQTYCTFKEITEEVKAKEALIKAKENAERSDHYSKIIAKLAKEIINSDLSIEVIAKLTYDYALSLTKSKYGFVSSIDPETGDNIAHTLSEMMKHMCNVENSSIIFPKRAEGYPSLWGHALNTQKAFYSNKPSIHPKSQGIPKGHIPLENFLSVPVMIKNKLVGQIALANKEEGYSNEDIKVIKEIGYLYGLAIYRKQTETELIQAKEKAEESDQLKSSFLANMSHEIRTPMNGILGFADLLKEPGIEENEREKFLGIIQKSGHRLLSIINDLIDISKIEAEQMEVFNEDTEINKQIEYLYTFFKPEAEKKKIELTCYTALPDMEATIHSDREKIYAILTNLIKNAIKYTKQGKIEFGYIKIENHLEFYVKDTGIGIQHSKLDSIFDRFVQANLTNATEYEGAGLGLAITKAYVELLGGNIWLESKVDKGSTFTFTLPIEKRNA
ncbi:PAS domain S-box protein [Lentimicrobium sp. S6]|uniref:PAS domain S-box protein n=1 Tax=Lentimicrobium sp. S6 TaxID=2735872 RepID=UPI001551753D|nr:PAS domain S-box protein [Lentimicrobium sp. S6]NPD44779.1 PAS domain S-box protein [Lentimicrobium sp. S6]